MARQESRAQLELPMAPSAPAPPPLVPSAPAVPPPAPEASAPKAPWVLVEPFAGGAALALHLLGARQALVPYQGSKWGLRAQLARAAVDLGFDGAPARVELSDSGPWGTALGVVLAKRSALLELLRHFAARDPREVFDQLQHRHVTLDPLIFTAEFLFLQRLSFSGKAVVDRGGVWVSPGFNRTSAYGTPATPQFGRVEPMVPSMVGVLERMRLSPVESSCKRACAALPPGPVQRPTLVYLDPPYEGVTGYLDSCPRGALIELALAWRKAGASVMVSEREPIGVGSAHQIRGPAAGRSPFRSRGEEWLSIL